MCARWIADELLLKCALQTGDVDNLRKLRLIQRVIARVAVVKQIGAGRSGYTQGVNEYGPYGYPYEPQTIVLGIRFGVI